MPFGAVPQTLSPAPPIVFEPEPGWHRLEHAYGPLEGCYVRGPRGDVFILTIEALNPGAGDFSRFLDRLPPDDKVQICAVVSPIVRGALQRRDWVEHDPPSGTWCRRYQLEIVARRPTLQKS